MAEVSTCPMFVFNHLTRECIPNTSVQLCIGEYALYSIREAFQTINTAYQYIPEHLCFEGRLEPLTKSLRLHSWRHTYQEVL